MISEIETMWYKMLNDMRDQLNYEMNKKLHDEMLHSLWSPIRIQIYECINNQMTVKVKSNV